MKLLPTLHNQAFQWPLICEASELTVGSMNQIMEY